jgi:hypothetical protein
MTSKFSSIIAARKGEIVEEDVPVDVAAPTPVAQPEQTPKAPRKPAPSPARSAPALVAPPRLGRPATGKRSNPDFEQVTAYIRRQTYQAIKIALIQEGTTRDFSDLTEELLLTWLKAHNK